MKIKITKILALVLALTLAFASFVIVASAADAAEITVSSVANADKGTAPQQVKLTLKKDGTLKKDTKIEITVPDVSKFDHISASPAADFTGTVAYASGKVTITVTADYKAEGGDKVIAYIDFTPKADSVGVVKLDPKVAAKPDDATVDVKGETVAETYTDKLSIGVGLPDAKTTMPTDPTVFKIVIKFNTAMDPKYYHGSQIGDYSVLCKGKVGDTVTADTALAVIKEAYRVYNALGDDDLGINAWIESQSGADGFPKYDPDKAHPEYNMSDFTLNEEIVLFNDTTRFSGEKLVASTAGEENVYTVYLDQVNVPKTVLMTIAEEAGNLGKDGGVFSQIANANVLAINEAIKGFQAFTDSLVNAEWPCAKDVKADAGDTSKGPNTGEGAYLGVAVIVALGLTCGTAVLLKKRED